MESPTSANNRRRGHFDDTCRPCVAVDTVDSEEVMLKCNCINNNGIPQYAYLPIGLRGKFCHDQIYYIISTHPRYPVDQPLGIRPIDGRFVCGDRIGSKAPSDL